MTGDRARSGRLHLVRPSEHDTRPRRHHGPVVLVVDDEDSIRDFLRSALEAEAYTVLAAGDGMDALALCDRYRPDLILLDLMMPRLDGMGFIREYRSRFGPEDVPICIMSAVNTAVRHAQATGVAGAFVKPFDLDELLVTIEEALGAAREVRADDARAGHGV